MQIGDYINITGICISTILSIISLVNISEAKKMINKIKFNNSSNNTLNTAHTIYQGNSLKDFTEATEKVLEPIRPTISNFKKLQEKIDSDPHYCIPINWQGTESEYQELIRNSKCEKDMIYITIPDEK